MENFSVTMYDKELTRLINVTKCIDSLYNLEEYTEDTEEKLNFLNEIENEAYSKIDINLENSEAIINRLYGLLFQTNYTQDTKEVIKDRICNYFHYIIFGKTIPSSSEDYTDRQRENTQKINIQTTIDYYRTLLFYLTDSLNNSKSNKEKQLLQSQINYIKYAYKHIEKIDYSEIKIDGRERCLMFGHEEVLIDCEYEVYCNSIIQDAIEECLSYTNHQLNYPTNSGLFKGAINSIKAALMLLDTEELKIEIEKYKSSVLSRYSDNETSIAIKKMTEVYEEVTKQKTSQKKKQKI